MENSSKNKTLWLWILNQMPFFDDKEMVTRINGIPIWCCIFM